MPLFILDWSPLGKYEYYRKTELYSMEWSKNHVNLSEVVVAASQFGGPIAVVNDERKFVKVQTSGRPNIDIFSASGQLITSIKWKSGRLIHMGWSTTVDLLCIQDDGTVLVYDLSGICKETFTMGQEAKDTKVLECKIFTDHKCKTGVAVLTGAYRIFLVNNISDPRVTRMAEVPGLDAPPSSWTVIVDEQATRVLVAKDAQLYVLDRNERNCVQVHPEFSTPVNAITEMSVSCNNQHLVLFTDSGILWMGNSDLSKKYCEFDTKCKARPQQLVWCGNGAVVGYWPNILLLVGPEKHYLHYSYYAPIYLVPEIDGVRIISNNSHDLLQKVPGVVAEIFRIGSIAPGALLLEAYKEFQQKSHKAFEYIRMIQEKNQLELAVNQCIQASGHEFVPSTQKLLLRAALHGKGCVPDMNPDGFVSMCQTLRVLNAVRDHKIGLYITYTQLQFLTVPVLLDRLVLHQRYFLATCICQHLKIPDQDGRSRILSHWACYKVKQTHADGDQVAQEIANVLGDAVGISYSDIANKAVECGHTQLAVKLLDYEPRASEQVPLLIKLKQDHQAMSKAIESGDTDLVYFVIQHLKDKLPVGDFHMTIRNFPTAYSLFLKLCKDQNLELLRDMYYQEDDFNAEADCRVVESYQTSRVERRISTLMAALESYKKARNDFASVHIEEQIRLLKYQVKLEEKMSLSFMDLSLHQTLEQLLVDKQYKMADDMRKEFKVPDRRFWWLKIIVLAENGQWIELERFSKSKKSPFGYEPFVDVCMKCNNKYEAQKYLGRIKDDKKIDYCIKVGMLEEAAKTAFEQKDLQSLIQIQNLCGVTNIILAEKINSMKLQLENKRS